ncbi:hypothetical protein ACNJFK_11785, partial [Mycobacterium tuberculosis]
LPVLRRRPAGRTRGCLLRSTPETSRRLRSQIRESPDSPGRFNPLSSIAERIPLPGRRPARRSSSRSVRSQRVVDSE